MESNFDYKIFLKVVTGLQENLEELKLIAPFETREEYKIAKNLDFKRLKYFSCYLSNLEGSISFDANELVWVAPWASAIVGVERMRISGFSDIPSWFVKRLEIIGPSSFHNLTQFAFDVYDYTVVSIGLDFAAGLKQPLKLLRVSELLDVENCHKFENLVEKNAKSLESLGFIVSTIRNDKKVKSLQIRLPALPKLQKLFFSVERGPVLYYNRSEIKVTLTFPGVSETVNYKEHLPSIRCMKIHPEGGSGRCT
ncbi:uncharacterized protein LOC118439458 [Folsomia candida]|uniref:uncharacterized protein LOC118439458 n=1 Tax=Folsomia candida TaxID=158441 RepID=UPI0016052FB7|nr:uncharacterized protein LOC118439458 [Folsomia candida]